MKNTFNKKNISRVGLLVVFSLVSFAQYGFANTWQPPTATPPGSNAPAPLNTSSTPQIKGFSPLDSTALQADPDVTLTLKRADSGKIGLFTEGFLSYGTIPTLGYISASLAKIGGITSLSRSPLILAAGSQAPLVNIVLSNVNSTNTKRLGVWSQKDANWANTRIRNGYFDSLIIGGNGERSFTYMFGGPQKTTASYTKRFMGFITYGGVHWAKPSPNDPDYNLNAPGAPLGSVTDCQQTNSYPASFGSYQGTHKFCYVGSNASKNFMYEAVPITTLDVAGETDIGNGGTCIVQNTDECPLGSYLQKIGAFGNNICKAFTGSCTNNPAPTLTDTLTGWYGPDDVAWVKAVHAPIGNLSCVGVDWNAVASSGTPYFFPNLAELGTIDLTDSQYKHNTIFYTPGTSMTQSPITGDYRVVFHSGNPNWAYFTGANSDHYIIRIGEAGQIVQVGAC